jgi:SnoaL-like domain
MHPSEGLARREIDLINAGNYEALDEVYADDLVIHYPGKNPLAGSHAAQDFLAKLETASEASHHSTKQGSGDHGCLGHSGEEVISCDAVESAVGYGRDRNRAGDPL